MSVLLFLFCCGVIAGMIGASKDDALGGFLFGFFLGPFGVIFALLAKGNRVKCPHCAELVRREAAVCKHCSREFS